MVSLPDASSIDIGRQLRIGETRQGATRSFDRGDTRGILNAPPPQPAFYLVRRKPAVDLTPFIEHYWMVRWDLCEGESHTQETLPHPNVHVVFEQGNSHAFGVVTGKFSRRLEGKSHVFGIRFAPAMFRLFSQEDVSQLTDRRKPVTAIFGEAVTKLEETLTSQAPEDELMQAADRFFEERMPARDPKAECAKELVRECREDRHLLYVDDLCLRSGMGKRTLQRLFREYVGVSPKWVIRRYRLQEAVESLRSGEELDYAQLAVSLGYFDQAHFIRDFKMMLSYTPTEFRKVAQKPPVTDEDRNGS